MKSYSGYIFDMDGVVYRRHDPIKEAVETINILREKGRRIMFITNSSASLCSEYRDRLLGIGIPWVKEEDFITSGNVAANYLAKELEKHPERKKVMCVTADSVKYLLKNIGMEVIQPEEYKEAHYVIAGFHTHFCFDVGNYAANAIAVYGAKFIGTNPDPARPVEGGEIEAGTGAILSFIETASHTKPLLMGKPYPEMYQMALQRMNLSISDALMIGDLLITDIKGAVDIGMDSALVLTGMTTRDDVEKSSVKPTYIVESLKELIVGE